MIGRSLISSHSGSKFEDSNQPEVTEEVTLADDGGLLQPEDIVIISEKIYSNLYGNREYEGTLMLEEESESSKVDVEILEINIDCVTTTKEGILDNLRVGCSFRHECIRRCYGCCFYEDPKKPNFKDRIVRICFESTPMMDFSEFSKRYSKSLLNRYLKMEILIKLASGINYFHSKNFAHRDLRPENIFVSNMGRVKIVNPRRFQCTRKIKIGVNSPAYIAPEQFFGETGDDPKLIDVYSFGLLIWELWTGEVSFDDLRKKYKYDCFKFLVQLHGEDNNDINRKIMRPDRYHPMMEDCPEDLVELMIGCWESNPKDRPEEFQIILEELEYIKSEMDAEMEEEVLLGKLVKVYDTDLMERVEYFLSLCGEEENRGRKRFEILLDIEKRLFVPKIILELSV